MAMEEKAKQEKKMSYDELKKFADDLYENYQKLLREYRGAVDALSNIDATSFYLNYAFKVMEHPEMYTDTFVKNCSDKIEYIVTKFANNMEPQQEEAGETE